MIVAAGQMPAGRGEVRCCAVAFRVDVQAVRARREAMRCRDDVEDARWGFAEPDHANFGAVPISQGRGRFAGERRPKRREGREAWLSWRAAELDANAGEQETPAHPPKSHHPDDDLAL